jgi:aerobic-type carbon monoxide dehydrogenase small subunit (CoxS/CutS family)
MLSLRVNGKTYQVDAEPATPLLWVLRDNIGLTGTKYGCGIAQCGACTVHVNGRATRSCVLPVSAVLTSDIVTIEGLSPDSQHPVQRLGRARCAAVRVLSVGADHGGGSPVGARTKSVRERHQS